MNKYHQLIIYLWEEIRKMSIDLNAKVLKLSYIRHNYLEAIKEANNLDLSYEDFLDKLLENEIITRTNNTIKYKIRNANFPYKMIFDDFKRDHLSIEIRQKIKELETLEFINNSENIILIGNPGTGKTALSIALGMKACLENKSVLFLNVSDLLINLKEVMSLNEINRYKKQFEKYDLVILDELGYCSFDKDKAEVLFNILSNRTMKGSMIITSNLTLERWKEVFNDEILTAAIIDRLAYKSHLIDMSGKSYRVIATANWKEKNKK